MISPATADLYLD